jgi:hypothetical protein
MCDEARARRETTRARAKKYRNRGVARRRGGAKRDKKPRKGARRSGDDGDSDGANDANEGAEG